MRMLEYVNRKFEELSNSLYSLKDYRPRKRDIVSGTVGVGLLFLSCVPASIPKPPVTPTHTPPPPASTQQLLMVTNSTFFDYNGNGIKESGEPPLKGIELTYQPGDYRCVTDESGIGIVKVSAGSYKININDSSNKFRCILPSVSEVKPIKDGLNVNIDDKNKDVLIPLGEGFLTSPIPKDAVFYSGPSGIKIHYFDVDKTSNIVRNWKGNGDIMMYDGHPGIDYMINSGTPVLAAAPGVVVEIDIEKIYEKEKSLPINYKSRMGNIIAINHRNGIISLYAHLDKKIVKIGEKVNRGDLIGTSGSSGVEFPHLHFELFNEMTIEKIDPYRNVNDPSSVSLWTIDNNPIYFK